MTISDLEAKLICNGSECCHDYTFLGVPVDSIEYVETGTSYIRFCKACGLEVERVEK